MEEVINKYSYIVFIDDYIGTGKQICDFWKECISSLVENSKRKDIQMFLISLVGNIKGINNIEESASIKPIVIEIRYRTPLDSIENIDDFLIKYGRGLYKVKIKGKNVDLPFGWGDSKETVIFFIMYPIILCQYYGQQILVGKHV